MSNEQKNSEEETKPSSVSSLNGVLKATEKYGVSLVLLLLVGYGCFNYVLLPIAQRFASSIDRVSAVNEDLRDKITTIATQNGLALIELESDILEVKKVVNQLERYFLAKSAKETKEEVQYPVQQYSQRRRWRR
jgi:hypothetical protein